TAKTIYAVDDHPQLLEELSRSVRSPALRRIVNHGDDFPGVPDGSVDLVFSFGTFVHLDAAVIDRYLGNIAPVLRPGADVVIQYSDKTKPLGRQNRTFSDNDPERMRALVTAHGYEILEEDTVSLWHSALMRFRLPQGSGAASQATSSRKIGDSWPTQ
ncbi:MAG TPA: class I SAM-dependent methyltransferase, partial [Solirubrobacterales bacterium]|nr:class I SAM-dependent methyltransferase [Solirubrobacterales bacterium]